MRIVRVSRWMPLSRLIRLLPAPSPDRITLIVPRGARALRQPEDLDLLALYAREHRLQIVLVAADQEIRRMAGAAGLEVSAYPPGDATAEQAAGSESPAVPVPHLPPWIMAGAFLGVLAAALLLLWPRPIVVVAAARQRRAMTVRARVSPDYRENQVAQARLPARLLTKTGLIVYDVPASGSRTEGVTPARGQVALLNDGTTPLIVPVGTIIETPTGFRFRTQAAVTVPPAKQDFLLGIRVSSTSGQAQAEVAAEQVGTQGNLPPGKLTVLLGPLGRRLKVVNAAALTGGTDRRVPVVTVEDIARAGLEAKRQMELQAPEELRSLTGEEQILLAESIALKPGRPAATPGAGEAGQSVKVSMPYSVQGLVLSRSTLARFLEDQARRQVPAHFLVAREAFTIQGVTATPRTPEESELTVTAVYLAVGRLERRRILAALAGRGEAEARAAVLALPEVDAVQMELPPGGRFPRFAGLIRLVLPAQDGR